MTNRLEKTALLVSGLTAAGIGIAINANPFGFLASYGVTLEDNASLLSELRAPAAGLVAFGAVMLAGLWRPAIAPISKAMALCVFLAFPVGRLIGWTIDGVPSGAIIGALVVEIAIAALCLVAFARTPGKIPSHNHPQH